MSVGENPNVVAVVVQPARFTQLSTVKNDLITIVKTKSVKRSTPPPHLINFSEFSNFSSVVQVKKLMDESIQQMDISLSFVAKTGNLNSLTQQKANEILNVATLLFSNVWKSGNSISKK